MYPETYSSDFYASSDIKQVLLILFVVFVEVSSIYFFMVLFPKITYENSKLNSPKVVSDISDTDTSDNDTSDTYTDSSDTYTDSSDTASILSDASTIGLYERTDTPYPGVN